MQFQLHTLGTIHLRTAAGLPIQSLVAQPKRLAVLVYLALATPDGFVRRDTLTGLFWPELDQQHARAALRKTIFHLRQSLGDGTVIGRGEEELALAPGAVWCDVLALKELLAEERPADALALYRGDLLDGFYLPETPAFDQWLDGERRRVRRLAAAAAWRAAGAEEATGHTAEAIAHGRTAIALSPDDENATRQLLSLLDRAGDSAGAFRLYEEHRHRLEAEFELQPAPETRALLERIRSRTTVTGLPLPAVAPAVASDPATHTPPASPGAAGSAAVTVARAPADTRGQPLAASAGRGRLAKVAALGVAVLAVAGVGVTLMARAGTTGTNPVLAVGHIQDFGQLDPEVAPIIRELLSTNLARVPGVQVMGNTRLYEMLAGGDSDDAASLVRAARGAGATEVVEGALYHLADGRLRLDLHRVALLTGAVSDPVSVEGSDPFAVVDAATRELATAMRIRTPALQVADVVTPSLTAFRLYEQGLRAYYLLGDAAAARPLFIAATAEDSTFAMAAYYASMVCEGGPPPCHDVFLEQARRMAARATEQDRLLILASWARSWDEPSALAIADSLVRRYPMLPEGHRILGEALEWDGRFPEAIHHLLRAFRLDSITMLGHAPHCAGCDALTELVGTYVMTDSMAAAERTARMFATMLPASATPWRVLENVLEAEGRYDEADAAARRANGISPLTPTNAALRDVERAVRRGAFTVVAERLAFLDEIGTSSSRCEANWWKTIGDRTRGRLADALAAAKEYARCTRGPDPGHALARLPEAIVLSESGRFHEAAAIFDSIAALMQIDAAHPGKVARNRAWFLTHEASALVDEGDLGRARTLADTIEALGRRSAYGRDRLLHYHVRGLIALAEGRRADAESDLRRAIFSPVAGYTRTNLELGRLLLAEGRPQDAIAILSPALRGPVEASGLYVTRTELHELLARAFDQVGPPDSVAVHYAYVAGAWRDADAALQPAYAAAATRLATLRAAPPLP